MKGNGYIDIRSLFSNFPKYGSGVQLISSIKIDNNYLDVHLILAIYNNMQTNIYPARVGQVGPFNEINIKGIVKEGYWDMMEYNRPGTLLPIMMIQTNTNFDMFYDFLYK